MKVRVEMSRGRQVPKTLTESVVQGLVKDGFVIGEPLDPLWERVSFKLTAKGWAKYHGLTGKAL